VLTDLTSQIAIRWRNPDPKYVPLLTEAGVTAVAGPSDEAFAAACSRAGIAHTPEGQLAALTLEEAVRPAAAVPAVLRAGVWPGIQRPDPQSAGASRTLWLDQNGALIRYIAAAHPRAPRVLGYEANKDAGVSPSQLIPLDALELGLVEAWAAGGNWLMAPDERLLKGIATGDREALTAWKRLGRTSRWLRANAALFRAATLELITVLVDSDMSREIASLAYRHSVSPALVSAAAPPAPDPARRPVLVAIAIDPPAEAVRRRILAHAEAGATVVVDGPAEKAWWRNSAMKRVRTDPERDFYTLGKGQVIAYRADIEDPGTLALDVIDIITQKRRPARVWNCNAGLAVATHAPDGGALLQVINYSRTVDLPVLARIQGTYRQATVLKPEAAPLTVKVAPRGSASEVTIPGLERIAVVVFK
jgi:hypothetical protein